MSRLQDIPLLHPSLTLHLSDNAETPIISSDPTPNPPSTPSQPRPHPRSTRSAALSSLNRSALASYTTAQRLNLGSPVRIIIECASTYHPDPNSTAGPMVLNTFIPPIRPAAAVNGTEEAGQSLSQTTPLPRNRSTGAGVDGDGDGDGDAKRPPLLVAVVVAPDGESQTVADASVAAGRLASVGRRLQARWVEEECQEADGS